jgi:A/G-specific adenine glycosylase
MNPFSIQIKKWYLDNKRDLPWRDTKEPYKIWLSEIILQQTRVDQGMEYFFRFIDRFPLVSDLANASEDEVLRLWQGLGYYSRARNLHKSAKMIVEEFGGVFPETHKDVLSLKGVGPYSAAAICSFAYDLPYAVLDGNVYRVLARYFNDDTIINSGAGNKLFQKLADDLLDSKDPATHNQAIMEFGAMQCTPHNPDCGACPLNNSCLGYEKGTHLSLPKKEKKVKVKDLFLNYLVFKDGANTFVSQRSEKDIWAKLFEFPLIISPDKASFDLFQPESKPLNMVEPSLHKLSHRNVYSRFWEIEGSPKESTYQKVNISKLDDLAKSRLIDMYLEKSFLF